MGNPDDPKYFAKLKQLSKDLNVTKYITFFGYISEKKKFDLLKRSHLLLHTSVTEGWGLVIPEANAMGTPASVYNAPGLSDSVIHNKNGLVCRSNSPASLSDTCLSALKVTNYLALQKFSVKIAANYNWINSIKKSLILINSL